MSLIRCIKITDDGVKHLSETLKTLDSLKTINLDFHM